MAKRLATLAAFLAVLLVGATATTTVTTVEIDEDENQWRGQGGCRQQIQQQGQLRHCQEFLREQARGGSEFEPRERWGSRQSQYDPSERSQYDPSERSQYDSSGRSQYGEGRRGSQFGPRRRGGSGSQQFDLCCNELRQLDTQCRCEGLSQIVRRQQQQQQGRFRGQGQEVEEIARVARNLPQQCGVGPQFCEIRALSI